MSEVLVTTVFVSEKALSLLIMEQTERNAVNDACVRLAAKRRELRKLQRETEELEQEVISKVKAMELKGIPL